MNMPVTKKRQRGPQKRAELTKARLMAAAIEAFSTTGFEGTTAAALEESAQVQRGLLAYHFGSKAALWRAAVDQVFTQFEAHARKLFAAELSARGNDRLGALIAAFVRSSAQKPELLNFIMREAKIESGRRDYIAEKHVSGFADLIVQVTGRAKSIHDFYMLAGAMTFVFVSPAGARRIWNTEPFSEAFIASHIEAVIGVFRTAWGINTSEPENKN